MKNGIINMPQSQHPLSALTAPEIEETTSLIQSAYPAGTSLRFKAVTLKEPAKQAIQDYTRQERKGRIERTPAREAFANYYIKGTVREA